jgi:hypothetical protein
MVEGDSNTIPLLVVNTMPLLVVVAVALATACAVAEIIILRFQAILKCLFGDRLFVFFMMYVCLHFNAAFSSQR